MYYCVCVCEWNSFKTVRDCTNTIPTRIWEGVQWRKGELWAVGHLERSWLPAMQGTAQKTPHGSFSTPCAPYWYTPKSLWPSCTSINYRAVSWWPCRAQSEIISGNICSSWSPARQFHCIESRQFQNSPLSLSITQYSTPLPVSHANPSTYCWFSDQNPNLPASNPLLMADPRCDPNQSAPVVLLLIFSGWFCFNKF